MPLFFIYYLFVPTVVIGFGFLLINILFSNKYENIDLGTVGILGYLFLYFISNLIHLFSEITDLIIFLVQIVGFVLFIYFLLSKKIRFFEVTKLFVLSILLLPIALISEPNEDFYYYYLPYLKYLETSNIIFGLVNLNDTLTYSTNSLYDILIFFKLPFLFQNIYSTPIYYLYIFYLIFLVNRFHKTKDIFYFFVLSLSLIAFTNLRDFGTSIPPQLILIMCGCLIYENIFFKYNEKKIVLIITLLTLALILRINSIIIFPLLILLIFTHYNKIFEFLFKNKLQIFFLSIILILFFGKNFIHSGCLIYPIHNTCFENLEWSTDINIVKQKNYKLQADSKGWSFYAKDFYDIKDKYVWKNLSGENFVGYSEYSKKPPFFWLKYWLKDPNYKKILNIFIINIIIFLFLIINSKKYLEVDNYNFNKKIIFVIFTLFSILIWFLLSPQLRYGGIFGFIVLNSVLIVFVNTLIKRKIQILNYVIIIILIFTYVELKNINRIFDNLNSYKFNNFPWTNLHNLKINKDFRTSKINNIKFNKRIFSNKLIFNNNSDYILMCGNVDFPCIPEGKEICLKEETLFKGYILYKHNKGECYNFMNKNVLY